MPERKVFLVFSKNKYLLDLSDNGLENYLREIHPAEKEEFTISEIDTIKTDIQKGDIIQLGKHRLFCGDSTGEDVKSLMDGKKADMTFTDPPYAAFGSSTGLSKRIVDTKMIAPFIRLSLQNIRQNTKVIGHVYIFMDWKTYPCFHEENKFVGMAPKNLIVWHKPNSRLGANYTNSHELIYFLTNMADRTTLSGDSAKEFVFHGETNVWVLNNEQSNLREHFAQKPLALAIRAIKNSSKNDDIILDLFGGSGSTLIACEQTGRKCYMMEIDPQYCQVIVDRWEKYTGQKAEIVKNGEIDVLKNSDREDN